MVWVWMGAAVGFAGSAVVAGLEEFVESPDFALDGVEGAEVCGCGLCAEGVVGFFVLDE